VKVVIHGFGSFPAIFFHVVQYAKKNHPEFEWSILLTTNHYESRFIDSLGRESVYGYSYKDISAIDDASINTEDYCGDLYRDIEAEKSTLKRLSGQEKVIYTMKLFYLARKFFLKVKPDIALVSQVEGIDGKVFIAAARSLGIRVLVPTGCRFLGGLYFSPDDTERLPENLPFPGANELAAARELISRFKDNPYGFSRQPHLAESDILDNLLPSLPIRLISSLRRWYEGRQYLDLITVRVAVQNNLPAIRDFIWRMRARLNRRYNNIDDLSALPDRFIFYPLQYTPESSINTPAPYFVDQLRAIDAIRFAMPNGCALVVKEHPACVKTRSAGFVKELLKLPGVRVARYDIPSLELIRRASLTISVTGTAVLEAALLGKPAIALGDSLVAHLTGGACGLDRLSVRISKLLSDGAQQAELEANMAKLLSENVMCHFGAPGQRGEPVLRSENIKIFTDHLVRNCLRLTNT
jgi:hypothetical protein